MQAPVPQQHPVSQHPLMQPQLLTSIILTSLRGPARSFKLKKLGFFSKVGSCYTATDPMLMSGLDLRDGLGGYYISQLAQNRSRRGV